MSGIYYDPEKYGLTVVDTLEEDLSYEFDIIAVWEDEEGNLWWGADSGCSCPGIFENYNRKEDLDRLTLENFAAFEDAVMAHDVPMNERLKMLEVVKEKLKAKKSRPEGSRW